MSNYKELYLDLMLEDYEQKEGMTDLYFRMMSLAAA